MALSNLLERAVDSSLLTLQGSGKCTSPNDGFPTSAMTSTMGSMFKDRNPTFSVGLPSKIVSGPGDWRLKSIAEFKIYRWLAEATMAETRGLEANSRELRFEPFPSVSESERYLNKLEVFAKNADKGGAGVWKDIYEGGRLIRRQSHIPISTPGSISLILQAVLPYLLFNALPLAKDQNEPVPLSITIDGGTNVSNSPSIEYVSQVLLPLLSRKVGIPSITTEVHKRGWSIGRSEVGSVTFCLTPVALGSAIRAFSFTNRGPFTKVRASLLAPNAKARDRVRDRVITHLLAYEPSIEIMFPVNEDSGNDKRYYLLLVAETSFGYLIGRDRLFDISAQGSSIEEKCDALASKVVNDLKREIRHGGCVDEYMQDQLVVFQALAAGISKVDGGKGRQGSLHTKTAKWVAGTILGVEFDDDERCEGVGFQTRTGSWPPGSSEQRNEVLEAIENLNL